MVAARNRTTEKHANNFNSNVCCVVDVFVVLLRSKRARFDESLTQTAATMASATTTARAHTMGAIKREKRNGKGSGSGDLAGTQR